MIFIIYFLIILTLLILIPIPIKFKMYYSLNDYYINIYNFTVFSKEKHILFKNKNIVSTKTPPKNNLKNKKDLLKNINYKDLLSLLYKRRFKPSLKLSLNLEYSLNDACNTAICYGLLNNINYPLYILFSVIFKIKKFDLNFTPKFEDKYFLKIESKSIVLLSFANIIYIALITLKYLLLSKEVTPEK